MPSKYEAFDWYENAVYYDIVFDEDTKMEADFIAAAHEKHGETNGKRLLEPACGSGRLLAAMAQRGYHCTGFDIADGMLGYAHKRLEKERGQVRLKRARMEEFHFPQRFDVAHCLVSTFKLLLTEKHAKQHLQCVAESLKHGGIYLLGLHLTDYDDDSKGRERWTGQRGDTNVVCNIQAWPPEKETRTERMRARLVVHEPDDDGNEVEKRYESNFTFRTYDLPQLKRLLKTAPHLEHVATYHFGYDIDDPVELGETTMDNILVLRKNERRKVPRD